MLSFSSKSLYGSRCRAAVIARCLCVIIPKVLMSSELEHKGQETIEKILRGVIEFLSQGGEVK